MKRKTLLSLVVSATLLASATPVFAAGKTYTHSRYSGQDRFDTALAIASAYNSGTLQNVVLATAYNFPDALTGSVLASKLNAPILLVGANQSESQKTLDFITSHLAKNGTVYMLGGSGVVPDSLVDYLKGKGYANFVRVGGDSREDTAKLIDTAVAAPQGTPVVIATENDFPDALSISSIAAMNQYPILLSAKDSLPQQTIDVLNTVKPSKVYVVGGTGVVSDNVIAKVKSVTGLSDSAITRLSGQNRYETSLAIAKAFNLTGSNIAVATGNDFPDALAGSVLAAKNGASILLVDSSDVASQKHYLDTVSSTNILVFGGNGVVSDSAVSTLATSSSTTPSQPASTGLQTATGLVTKKVTYTDSEIPDNPTQAQMQAMATDVTYESNPAMFSPDYTNVQELDPAKMNLTGKVYHNAFTVNTELESNMHFDSYVKVLSMHIDGSQIDKIYTRVTYKNGVLMAVSRSLTAKGSDRDEFNYLYNEK